MFGQGLHRFAGCVVLAISIAACTTPAPTPTPGPNPTPAPTPTPAPFAGITVGNLTTVEVAVAINNVVVATVPASAGFVRITSDLPARPFTVDARSPSGHILATVAVGPNDIISDQASRLDIEFLACGDLYLQVGGPPGDKPHPVGSGYPTPAPCD